MTIVGEKAHQEARFWRKVKKGDGCWIWKAGQFTSGHGSFCVNGQDMFASRFSWELHNGPIPPNMLVLHKCDVPRCVNPDHLYLGTPKDNGRDRWDKRPEAVKADR